MRPVLLEMDGFASFRDPARVDFREADYFALVGPTGSGKSTVIDAMTFALYGSVPRWDDRRMVANALAPTTNRGTVRLVFDLAGQRYVAARELRRGAAGGVSVKNARLERLTDPGALGTPDDDTEVLAADSEVTHAVEELLGLSFEHFTACVVLPQGDFAEFLHAKPAKRQDILVKLLGLEVYTRIAQAANAEATSQHLRAEISTEQLEEFADATEQAQDAAQGHVTALEEIADQVGAALPQLRRHGTAVAETQKACAQLTGERDQLQAVAVPAGLDDLGRREQDTRMAVKAAREALAAAEAADGAIREQLAAEPPRAPLEQARRDHVELLEAESGLPAAQALQEQRATALAEGAAALEAATKTARQARRAQEAAAQSNLAAALRPHLQVGAECPVCEQQVTTLPIPLSAPDLEAAEQALARAELNVERLRNESIRASRTEQQATSDLHTLTSRIAVLRSTLTDTLTLQQITVALAHREQLETAACEADTRLLDARTTSAGAERALESVRAEVQAAWSTLEHVRDPLVALKAPVLARDDLVTAWATLLSWAADSIATCELALSSAQETLARAQDQLTAAEDKLVRVLAAHHVAPGPGRPLVEAAEPAAAAALEGARQEVRRLIERREQAERLAARRQDAEQRRQVANTLGQLLRSDGFPRWLVATALDALVVDASRTLAELSGGQFELTHDDGNFIVIDHTDADSRRPVKTLSGGETFQASLALALTLSAQLSTMAAAGAARLESIFLDEGFGTLDEATLEMVAATLEELATHGNQMVGIVTHVSALAERVQTRFAVHRDQRTSSVQREGP